MSDQAAPPTATSDGGPVPSADQDTFTLPEAVRLIEDRKQIRLADDETERLRFLKMLREGRFPAPVKPTGALPRIEAGGDIDWSDVYWSRKDVDRWLGGEQDSEDYAAEWDAHRIKRHLDLSALASYCRRRILKGDYEWTHWQDSYRPRAFTGPLLALLIWAGLVGYGAFVFLASFNEPVLAGDSPTPVTITFNSTAGPQPVYKYSFKDPETGVTSTRWAVKDEDQDRYIDYAYIYWQNLLDQRSQQENAAYITALNNEIRNEWGMPAALMADPEVAASSIKKIPGEAAGQKVNAPAYQINFNQEDDSFALRYNGNGENDENFERRNYTRNVDLPGTEAEQDMLRTYALGVPEKPFLSFLAADLSGMLFPGASVPMILFLLIGFLPLFFGVLRFLHSWLSLSYTLKDSLLIVREGLLSRREHQVRVIQIKDLSVNQGPLQRVLGVGTISVSAPDDTDSPELEILGVRDPRAVKDRIFEISESAKQDKRYYIESTGGSSGTVNPAR